MSKADDMVDEDKKQSPHLTKIGNIAKLIGKFFIFVIALIIIIAGAISIYIHQAGGLASIIERNLSSPEWGIETRIETVRMDYNFDDWSLDVSLSDIETQIDAQQISLPELALRISPSSLYSGSFFSTMIEGLVLELVQEDEGVFLAGDWAQLKTKVETLSSRQGASRDKLISALAARHLVFKDSQIIVRKQGRREAEIIHLDATMTINEAGTLSVDGLAHFKNHNDNQLSFTGQSNILSGLSTIQLKADTLPSLAFAPFLPELLAPIGAIGTIDGDVTILLDRAQLQSADGFFSAHNGVLPLDAKQTRTAAFTNIQSQVSYSRADDYLIFSEMQLILPDGRKMGYNGEFVGLHQDIAAFKGSLLIEDLPSDTLLTEWPENALSEVRSYMIESFQGGAFDTLALVFEGQFDKAEKRLSLSALSLNGEVDDVRVKTGFGQYKEFVGTAKGRLSVDVGIGGSLQSARLKLGVRDGYIIVDKAEKPINFTNASGEIIYQKGQLLVPELRFDFDNEQSLVSSITVTLDDTGEPQSSQIAVNAPLLDVDIIYALWPEAVAKKTSTYLENSLMAGQLSAFDLSLSAAFRDENQQLVPQLTSLETEFDITNAQFRWLKGQPPLSQVKGHVSLADNVVSILIDEGAHDRLQLETAEIYINPAIQSSQKDRLLTIKATAKAPLEEALSILNAPQVNIGETLPVDINEASGQMRASLHLTGNIMSDGKLGVQLVKADGTIQKGAVDNIFRDFDIADADLVFAATPQEIEVTGSAQLSDVPGHFNIKNTEKGLQITGKFKPSPLISEMVAQQFDQEITGALGGRFTIEKPPVKDAITLFLAADLSEAGINVPLLNWAKIPSEAGQASAAFIFEKGLLKKIEKISVDAGSLRAKGVVMMDQQGQLQEAVLADVKWPGNDLDKVIIKPDDEGVLFVQGEGDLLDLRAVRSGQGISEGRQIRFDLTANRLLIEQDVDLYGRMTGEVREDGNGTATLQGALIIGDKPLLEQGTVTALFGPDGEYLTAVGLIGGAEARLEYSPEDQQNPLLIITSQNAGRTLSGLGITDTIRSGRMVLVNEFINDGFSDYNTTINLEEFNVIEAPAAVRAFSVLGLAGLYSLVEGDGTRFTRGEALIETNGKDHNIKSIKASGGAVGITMLGHYNSETKQVDVSGNLVPVNQFSKIIGAVPVLGELLSGIDKSGLFATQFNVTGDIADPETSVNAASIAPGFIRDLFSPNWLARERNRILGQDNQTEP